MEKLILTTAMSIIKKYFCSKYGIEWFTHFKKLSYHYFDEVIPQIPDIGKSIFSINYLFAPAYIAWYKAMEHLNMQPAEIDKEIWILNENLMGVFPKFLLKASGKMYLSCFQAKATNHINKQNQGKLHPFDWKIAFRTIDDNCFEIDVTECAYQKLAAHFHVEKMLPGICRMDYLMANLMGNGFTRTKTLGDGDTYCNCKYAKTGYCEWAPEKGFTYRK